MTGYGDVTRVVVPMELFTRGHSMLRHIGRNEVEGLILWAGQRVAKAFYVQALLQPAQRATRQANGLVVLVDGAELHRVGVWLYERNMELIAQLHTHPTAAYHSPTDDAIPIVTTEGGLSLVVPHFARGDAQLSDYAVYRLDDAGRWMQMTVSALNGFICIVNE